MKFVCLKCGGTWEPDKPCGFWIDYWGGVRYDKIGRYKTCPNCNTCQPIRPIEAAIWIFKGMPKIKA